MLITELNKKAFDVLNNTFGYSSYRYEQEKIINSVLSGNHTLAIMPTGAGKSLCYQIPAIISSKKTVIISPLISLMDDQVSALKECGVQAAKIHSDMTYDERSSSWNNFKNGKEKIIYLSPEKIMSEDFLNQLKTLDIGLFVIDEIHCVSKWGHNFRPDYNQLSQLKSLFPNSNIIGFTATADQTTRLDILEKIFNKNVNVFVSSLDRPNLSLSITQKTNWKSQLLEYLRERKSQSGIIYCLSKKKTEEVTLLLNDKGFNASTYHAGLDGQVRKNVQDTFMTEQAHIVVATIAFGMGIDKPDIRFVIHLNLPGSVEAYSQEIGRAGRDGNASDTLLIYGLDDLVIRRRMIEENSSEDKFKFHENKRLDYLLSYCETPECRRKVLLSYFDEESENCNNCDNCINPPSLIDGTILAQKLLSTVYRTGQFYGQVHIINVLRGSEDKKILDKGHQKLSVYGLGKDKTKEFWQSFLRQMLAYGHLKINFQKYGAIEITNTGIQVLKNEQKFMYKEIPTKPVKDIVKPPKYLNKELSNDDNNLLNELKSLRLDIAKQQRLPAYTVFHDSTLIQMSQNKPTNEIDMLEIDGVGPTKFKKYGELFIDLINKHI
tara:strand:+ start:364 stop:2178 length:1815 start_codon:yes stop_codon:yes gene_type:complete